MEFKHSTRKRAMTLLELLVVLVILAIVATIAVHSLQPRVDQARFEQTRKTLTEVEIAVRGQANALHADGTPMISGFVADVGRLPRLQASTPDPNAEPVDTESPILDQKNSGQELCELWDPQSTLAKQFPFQIRSGPTSPIDYSDIRLPCGWRGPYLNLAVGQDSVRDSWSNPFEIAIGENQTIEQVAWQPVTPFENENLQVNLTATKTTVTGSLNLEPGATVTSVVLLIPDPEVSTTELVVLEDMDPSPEVFLFENVPIGLRALRVQAGGQKITKYLHVPPRGVSLVVEVKNQNK